MRTAAFTSFNETYVPPRDGKPTDHDPSSPDMYNPRGNVSLHEVKDPG